MFLKRYLRPFVPPIYYLIKRKLLNKEVKITPLAMREKKKEHFLVMGNGPSLNTTIEKYSKKMEGFDVCAVNNFAQTSLFTTIKPSVYVLADPGYFTGLETCLNPKTSCETFHSIVNNTTWPMTIVIPDYAKGLYADLCFQKNDNLTVYYLNTKDIQNPKIGKYEAWDKNLTDIPFQTVLNLCVWLGIYWGYKETYIIGADSSFLEDIRIDQNTNELLSIDRHFYNADDFNKDKEMFNKDHLRPYPGWKLHELIFAYGKMFEYYDELQQYANYKGVKVYNASEYSWINCFERKKLG